MPVINRIASFHKDMTAWRHDIHSHPETAFEEVRTADIVADGAMLFVGGWLLTGDRMKAAIDELAGGGGRVFFANSGAEANECAIKLARRHGQRNGGPERFHVVSAYRSFHGRTLTTLAGRLATPIGTPWYSAGRKAEFQLLSPPWASVGQMVMKPGRSSLSVPRP